MVKELSYKVQWWNATIYSSTLPHFRGKCCSFYSITCMWQREVRIKGSANPHRCFQPLRLHLWSASGGRSYSRCSHSCLISPRLMQNMAVPWVRRWFKILHSNIESLHKMLCIVLIFQFSHLVFSHCVNSSQNKPHSQFKSGPVLFIV